jgi:hypothetical protein
MNELFSARDTRNAYIQAGTVNVDSGQIIIIDPCYLLDGDNDQQNKYENICKITLSPKGHGEILGGFVSETYYGDGSYPIYAEITPNGQILRMTIDFDPEFDEEEDYDDDDEDF